MAQIIGENTADASEVCATDAKNGLEANNAETLTFLVKKVRKKDKDADKAFEKIVTLCEKSVYELAWQIVKTREDALDVSQITFVKLWRILDGKDASDVQSWHSYIMKITRNAALDFLRRQKIRKADSITVCAEEGKTQDIEIPDSDVSSDPVKSYERKENILAVREAIASLEDDYRTVVVMRDMNDMSYKEISEVTGLEMGTVKSRIHRARGQIREYLAARNFFL